MNLKIRDELKDKPHVIIFLLILVFSIGFRAVYLDQPVRYDEAYTFNNFASESFFTVVSDYHAPNNHIFHTIFVHASYLLLGKDEVFMRLPAFIFGILSIVAIYFLARKMLGKKIAMLSMVLLSVSQLFIEFSSDARGYTLAVLLAIMTVYFVTEALRTEKLRFWLISSVLASLLVYTVLSMFYFVFGVFTWVIFVKFNRLSKDKNLKTPFLFLILSSAISIALYVPALVYTGIGWIMLVVGKVYSSPVSFDTFLARFPSWAAELFSSFSLGITHIAFLSILFLLGYYFLYREKGYDKLILFLSLPAIVFLLVALQSILPPSRVFIYLLPFLCMLAAKGIAGLLEFVVSPKDLFPRYNLNKILPVLIILAFLAQGTLTNLVAEKQFPQDSMEAAEWLKAELKPGDDLLIYCCEDQQIEYYMGKEFYEKYANLKSNVSRMVIVVNPSNYGSVEEFVKEKFETRGASEYELLTVIGRLNIYHSTRLENFTYHMPYITVTV